MAWLPLFLKVYSILEDLRYLVSKTLRIFDPSKLNNNALKQAALQSLFLALLQLTHVLGPAPGLHRKEVIQPHLPIRLPCYDLTPIIEPTFGSVLLAVRLLTSGIPNFHGLTGGVYKARERIHRGMLIRDY